MNIKRLIYSFLVLLFLSGITSADIWKTLGKRGFTAGEASSLSIAVDANNTTYVAFIDATNGNKVSVMKYNGTDWVLVGNAGFSTEEPGKVVLAIDGNNIPYVVINDGAYTQNPFSITVRKFDGSDWVLVGNENFVAGSSASIAIDGNNTPYIMNSESQKLYIRKFDGSSWAMVGGSEVPGATTSYTSFAIDKSNNNIYVAYDGGNVAMVKKFDGSSWTAVGASFPAEQPVITLDNYGTPYIVNYFYKNVGDGRHAMVKKFDDSVWVAVGDSIFDDGNANQISIKVNKDNIPYVLTGGTFSYMGARLYRFVDGSWETLGYNFTDQRPSANINMAFDTSGIPLVVNKEDEYASGDWKLKATVWKLIPTAKPLIANNTGLTLDEGAAAVISSSKLLATDADTDDSLLVYEIYYYNDKHGALRKDGVELGNYTKFTQKDINDGVISYAHDGGETTRDSIAFTVSDENWTSGTYRIYFTINPVNDIPEITKNTGLTVDQMGQAYIDDRYLSSKDQDTDDSLLVYKITSGPFHGGIYTSLYGGPLTPTTSFSQKYVKNSFILYKHDGSDSFTDSLIFTLTDGTNEITGQVFNIAINPDVVLVKNDTVKVAEGETVSIDKSLLLAAYPGAAADELVFKTISMPRYGALQNNGVDLGLSDTFTQADINAGYITYAHDGSETTIDAFSVHISYGSILAKQYESVIIAIAPVDDPPVMKTNTELTLDQNATATIEAANLSATDVDTYNDSLLFTITSLPINGELKNNGAVIGLNDSFTQADIKNSKISYSHSVAGTTRDLFTFSVTDGTNEITGQAFIIKINEASGWELVGNAGFANYANSQSISMALDDTGIPYVAYGDGLNDGSKATVMKYDGGSWVNVGSAGFSAGEAEYTSIAIDGNGTPYITFRDKGISSKAVVKKYDGANWVDVGDAVSKIYATYTDIAIDANNNPYVVYSDAMKSYAATVKKFEGGSWVTVGSAGFSAGQASSSTITLDAGGTPYVAFQDAGNSLKITVMKYDSSGWAAVGNPGFSDGTAYDPCIAITSGGIPYVAYGDPFKATVKKFNGTDWETVGSANFTPGQAAYISLKMDGDDNPVLSFRDAAKYGVSVMKYDGSDWAYVGGGGFRSAGYSGTSLAIGKGGVLYTAFQDGTTKKATVMKNNNTQNKPPTIAVNNGLSLDEGTISVIDSTMLKAADEDSKTSNLLFAITTEPAHGELQLSGKVAQYFKQSDILAGNIKYVHDGGETTSDSFTFSISDWINIAPDEVFNITVNPVNDLPQNTSEPVLTGSAGQGDTLSVDNGVWSDADNTQLTFTYKWYSDADNAGYDGTAIAGAADSVYILTNNEVDRFVYAVVAADDGFDTVTANSNYTGKVVNVNDPPANITVPSISGTATEDVALTISLGAWNDVDGDTLTFTYQWFIDSDNADFDGVAIANASDTVYTPTNDNVGSYLYAIVTANDGYADKAVNSNYTNAVVNVNDPPQVTTEPVNSGTTMEGEVLSVTTGNWDDIDGDALTFTYQWYSDSDSLNYDGSAIANAADSVYTCTANDVGNYIYAVVTANDGNGGSVSANSNYTATAIITGVEDAEIPTEFSLSQNYPNPFNPSTILKYGLKEETDVRLEVFNLLGERVITLVNERQNAGYYNLRLNMSAYSTGVYIYRLQAGSFVSVKKMIMVK